MAKGHNSAIFLNTKKCNLGRLPPFHSFKAFEKIYLTDCLRSPSKKEATEKRSFLKNFDG